MNGRNESKKESSRARRGGPEPISPAAEEVGGGRGEAKAAAAPWARERARVRVCVRTERKIRRERGFGLGRFDPTELGHLGLVRLDRSG